MVIKRKKGCKIIYFNDFYFVEGEKFFNKYRRREEAEEAYRNITKFKALPSDKFEFSLYKEDVEIILKSLQNYKHLITEFSFLQKFNKEKVYQEQYNIDFLYMIINTIYINNNYEKDIDIVSNK